MKCYEIFLKLSTNTKYYPKGSKIIIKYGIIITTKDRIVDRWMDGWMDVMWHILNENFQFKLNFILLCMDEILLHVFIAHVGGAMKNHWQMNHTTWRMKLFMNGNGILLYNFFFLMKLTTWMSKGIMWVKVNDMDEINPIINLFHKFILFYFWIKNQCDTKAIYFLFFLFSTLLGSLLWVVVLNL